MCHDCRHSRQAHAKDQQYRWIAVLEEPIYEGDWWQKINPFRVRVSTARKDVATELQSL